jgi:glyoxylase-like metal-dependent hydrolase (beta-lactamase superfamily II)
MKITYQHFQKEGIITLDTQMMRPLMVSSHLILQNGKAAFVDVGASPSIPYLLQGLHEHNLSRADVEYVIVTHVHLDHAGGVGALMRQLPNAMLVVHPRGSRHMIDPSKLIAGASAVYGQEEIAKTYGEILPVHEDRVIVATDGFQLDFDGRILEFWNSPGHARHHFCIIDHQTRSIFTGDSFGLSYREFDCNEQVFILPTTSPVQFDPDEMKATIQRIADYQPQAVYLTHFSRLEFQDYLATDLLKMVDAHVEIAQRSIHFEKTIKLEQIKNDLWELLWDEALEHGCKLNEKQAYQLLALDLELNAQGLVHWLQRTA